jgi:ABC-2 type transport system permease protein
MPQFLGRTLAIARKEVRQLRRDRLTFGMIVGIPLIQLVLFGYAINQDVRHLRAGVADLAGTQRSRLLAADAAGSQVVDIVAQAETVEELEALLRKGRISVGIAIPRDFERRAQQGERPPAQLLVDGSDPIVLGAARGIAALPVERRFQAVLPAAARPPAQTSRSAPTTTPSDARRCRSSLG